MGKLSKLSRNKRTEAARLAISRQPARTAVNRQRKLAKHLVKQPNDKQAQAVLQRKETS